MKCRSLLLFAAPIALVFVLSACSGGKQAPSLPDSGAFVLSGADVSASDVTSGSDAGWYAELDATGWEIARVILSGSDAFSAKDKSGYMATIDRESEAYAETRRYVNYIFKHYDLASTIDRIEIVSVDGGTATVRVTQTTVKKGECEEGRTFADAQTVLLHTMTRRAGAWYISSTVVESRRELADSWKPLADFVNSPVSGSDKAAENTEN